MNILIVEDDALIAQDLVDLLTDWGYYITSTEVSAEKAIQSFKANPPDLALVDIQIEGDSDGIELAKQLNLLKKVPIIFLTAQSDEKTVNRARLANPAAYLLKPFHERNLQISLELAFHNFFQEGFQSAGVPHGIGSDTKLSADVFLKKDQEIFVKQNYRFVKFDICEVLFLEADRNHTFIVTKTQKLCVRVPLAKVVQRLQDDRFVRVHRSFAINSDFVDSFDDNEIILQGKPIPFTNAYRDDFFKHFNIV